MKKLSTLLILTASLLLSGCGEDDKEKTTETTKAVKETVVSVEPANEITLNEVKDTVVEKAEEKVEEKVEEKKTTTATPNVSLNVCYACHGSDFGLKALGASKIVKDMTKADIITALKGYKDGSYGGNMKFTMVPHVAQLDDAAIEAMAAQIVDNY